MRSEFDGLRGSRLGRRAFLRYAATAGVMGVLAACDRGSAGRSTASTRAPVEAEPGTLRAYERAGFGEPAIWKEYRRKGYPDPRFSFFTETQRALARTAAGQEWDVARAEIGYVQDYLDLGAIQAWDTSLIANFPRLNPALQTLAVIHGDPYEIVTDWGYSGVIARSDRVDVAEDSYSILFDDRYAGHISWFDTPWVLQQAGLVLGVTSDVFDMTPADLETTKAYCIRKKKNLHDIWVDAPQMREDVRTGRVWAAYAWQDAWVALREHVPVRYIKPKEGVLAWSEGLILSARTANYRHAHDFADAWTSPATGLWFVNAYGYGHSNLDVDLTQVDPEIGRVLGLNDPVKALSGPLALMDRYQPQREAYRRAWDEVKSA